MIYINVKGVLYGIVTPLPPYEKQKISHHITIASIIGY